MRAACALVLCASAYVHAVDEETSIGPAGANLRAAPSDKAFTVSTLREGTPVTVVDTRGEWVGVSAPQGIPVWVYGDLVREGVVIAPRMLIRAGPGIDYEGVGELRKGDRVNVRGKEDDWLKIAPPADVVFWVKRTDLRGAQPVARPEPVLPPPPMVTEAEPIIPPPAVAKPEPILAPPSPGPESVRSEIAPPVAPPPPREQQAFVPPQKPAPKPELVGPTPGVQTTPDPVRRMPIRPVPRRLPEEKPEPPALVAGPLAEGESPALPAGSVERQERTVTGKLRRAPVFPRTRYANFRLVQRNERGQIETLCYLLAPESRLTPLIGREVRIVGREYLVPGERYPALVPSEIELAP